MYIYVTSRIFFCTSRWVFILSNVKICAGDSKICVPSNYCVGHSSLLVRSFIVCQFHDDTMWVAVSNCKKVLAAEQEFHWHFYVPQNSCLLRNRSVLRIFPNNNSQVVICAIDEPVTVRTYNFYNPIILHCLCNIQSSVCWPFNKKICCNTYGAKMISYVDLKNIDLTKQQIYAMHIMI
jgi:hypothetical protein